MTAEDSLSRPPGPLEGPPAWPVVSPDDIVVAEFDWDLAYMGVYLRLELCNRSAYLVREAELRVDGRVGMGGSRAVTSRQVKTGPMLPGVYVHEEVGIGEPGGILGVSFNPVAVRAVSMTPPDEMVPAAEYPDLAAEILRVTVDPKAQDLRMREGDRWWVPRPAEGTSIRIRVRNAGRRVVERVRLKLSYFKSGGAAAAAEEEPRRWPVAEWILDMPRKGWNPYQRSGRPVEVIDPADPLPPGRNYQFGIVHYDGGPHGWAGRLDAVSVEVCELKLGA